MVIIAGILTIVASILLAISRTAQPVIAREPIEARTG
jgi:hypothetical protein